MKRAYLICLLHSLTATLLFSQSNPVPLVNPGERLAPAIGVPQADPKAQAMILDQYGKLPLSFEANQGQADGRVKFLSRTGGYSLFLTADEAVLTLRGKKTKQSSPQGLAADRLAADRLPADRLAADRLRFVSGYRFSDTASSAKLDAPLGAGQRPSTSSADPEVVATRGVLRMKLRNASLAAKVTGQDELAGTSNYFTGNDPAKWRTNVPTYAKVKYEGIYPGVDLVYYGNQRQLEYDFIVAPGADPRRIAFDVTGAKRIRRGAQGDLVFKVGEGEIRWHKPVVYQEKDGTRQEIAAHYATDKNRVAFEVAKYDTSRPLYIDPLIYSTYLGGSGQDIGQGIAVDSAGNAYVTGQTYSTNFPTTPGAFQTACNGNSTFVAKFNPTGSALVYSTYLCGGPGRGIAVDSAGNAYVAGAAGPGFPITPGAFQTVCKNGSCAYLTKLNPAGSALVYSTYLGGSVQDQAFGIAVDSAGNAYITGQTYSTDFPITPGAFQTACDGGSNCYAYGDAFVAKISPDGSSLVYSTFLGGSFVDYGQGITVDSSGNAYVVGITSSSDFPTMNPLQPNLRGYDGSAFVTKLNPTGSALVYSTYLGGSVGEGGEGIAVDSLGNVYVTGLTLSADFPTTPGAFQTVCNHGSGCGKQADAFVARLNSSGSALVYSTYLGGSGWDQGYGIAVDSACNAYVTGYTQSTNFPTTPGASKTGCGSACGNGRAFVSKLNPAGSILVYSTDLGGSGSDVGFGIALDSAGNAYVAGRTNSINFPTKNPLQPANGGNYDAFVTKMDMRAVPIITLTSSPNPSTYGQAVTFTATLTSTIGAPPDGETVTFMKGTAVLGTGTLSGGSASYTTSTLPAATNYIKAVYRGDSNFLDSTSKAVKLVVNKATTTTTLTSSLNPSSLGQSVTFTVTVKPQFSGTVKGTVTFYDGTTALKTVSLSGGVAKYATSALTVGAHTITSTYSGGSNFDGSSASLTQTVN
jgi:Bacterial Ig-like domain (group 3)/Beta-propeller repeat